MPILNLYEFGKNANSTGLEYARFVIPCFLFRFVWRQSEFAFFGALTTVDALFILEEKMGIINSKSLVVVSEQQPGIVLFHNYDTLKAELEKGLAYYNGFEYSVENIDVAILIRHCGDYNIHRV